MVKRQSVCENLAVWPELTEIQPNDLNCRKSIKTTMNGNWPKIGQNGNFRLLIFHSMRCLASFYKWFARDRAHPNNERRSHHHNAMLMAFRVPTIFVTQSSEWWHLRRRAIAVWTVDKTNECISYFLHYSPTNALHLAAGENKMHQTKSASVEILLAESASSAGINSMKWKIENIFRNKIKRG